MASTISRNISSLFKTKILGSLAFKTGALAFLTFILFAGVTYLYLIPRLEQVFINKKKEMLKNTIDMTMSHMQYYHKKTLSGTLTTEQAKSMAASHIRNCRYGKENKDYFWINDMKPVMIVHPYKSELEGKNLSNYKDPSGKKVFMDMIAEVKDDGQGFVQYEWQWRDRKKHILPKISYVKKFEPWDWVVGTGMYIKDIETELSVIKARITWIFGLVMAIIIMVLSYITRQSSISEKKRLKAEKKIKSSQQLMEAILETTQDGILVGNINGTFSFANAKFSEMWNIPPEIIQTKSREKLKKMVWSQLKDPDIFFNKLQKLYESTDIHLDYVEFKDGRIFERFSAPLNKQKNEQVRVWSFRDITEERKNKAALKVSEQKYRILVNSSPNIILTFEDGRCTFANPAAHKILQYKHGELLKKNIMDIVAEQHLDAVSNMIDELFKGIKINDQEILMKRQDNTEIFTSFFIVHPYETVKKNYFVIIAKDITGQKETERKILNAVIETQERERKTFAENLHDELGPFLSGIKFYVEEITHDEPTTQKKELVEYLKKMTDQAISNTRSISNQLMPNVLVNYGLYKAINTFCEHLQIVNKISIELSSNKPGKQYDKKIELTLYRVIIELINNTLKHANATIVKISFIDNENQLTISYEDNGKGFDFENYIIGGKGLGIQNIISRIKLLKGELHFKSKPGKGFNINIQLNV